MRPPHLEPDLEPAKVVPLCIMLMAGAGLWFLPSPEGVSAQAWHLLAIFVATIVGIIARPLPMGAVALLAIVATVLTGTLTINQALSGFSNRVIWLIVAAFLISRGFQKTGLSRRIALGFVRLVGKRTLGLGYGLVATDLVLAPAIPSNSARAGGVVFPILRSLAEAFDSRPNDGTAKRMGAFLSQTAFQGTLITSAMFMTAMAANPLAAELAGGLGVEISWARWAVAALVPGMASLVFVPLFLYWLTPPEVKATPKAREMAGREIQKMGPIQRSEWTLLVVVALLLCLWVFGQALGLHSTTAALTGLALLLTTGVLTWKDICREEEAWNTLVWFAALVTMASFLNEFGFIQWFSQQVAVAMGNRLWLPAFLGLSVIYFYSHYTFASNTAHVSSMYAPFLAAAIAVGAPQMLSALVLAFFSNLWSSTTHYGTGPAPIFFGAGFVDLAAWWRIGAYISVINISIWLLLGGVWWKVLGLW